MISKQTTKQTFNLKQTYHSVLNGFIEQLLAWVCCSPSLNRMGSEPLDPLVIVNFRFCLVIGIFNGTIKSNCSVRIYGGAPHL
jgi:hypothetical protein